LRPAGTRQALRSHAHRDIWLTTEGQRHLRGLAEGLTGVWTSSLWRHELVEKALSAQCCFERDQHYIVADGKVQIVDESTGRVMPDRSWDTACTR